MEPGWTDGSMWFQKLAICIALFVAVVVQALASFEKISLDAELTCDGS